MSNRGRARLRARGQSVVEFTLVVPIMLIIMLGVIDLARIYTTMLSVESAAREAADYATFGSQRWSDTQAPTTVAKMQERACIAASDLPDYEGPDTSCTNPGFAFDMSLDKGTTWSTYTPGMGCDDATRTPPCWVRVTLEYDFHLLVPVSFEALGTRFGLPSTLTFQRSSIFAMTDLDLP